MRLVERCEVMPHHCAATLKADDPKGFVDTGTEIPCIDPHIYLSVSWLQNEVATAAGLVSAEDHQKAIDAVVRVENELAAVRNELTLANAELDAISVIESSDRFHARRKPGPKPWKKVAA